MTDDELQREKENAKPPEPKQVVITDRDINELRSAGEWLRSRSNAFSFAVYQRLMSSYGIFLLKLADKLEPIAVVKPVTMDELFNRYDGETKNDPK